MIADGNGGANYSISYVNNTAGVNHTRFADGHRTGRHPSLQRHDDVRRSPGTQRHNLRCSGHSRDPGLDNRNAGTGKTLAASGLLMADGNGGANYAVNYVSSTAGVINPALLTVTAQPDTRVYNGTTSSGVTPVVSGATYDPVGTAASQTFDTRNAGNGKTLTASGLLMADGNGGTNYSITYVSNTAGVITVGAPVDHRQ